MAIGFKTVKAALALNPKPALGFTSAANPEMLPQPKPRAALPADSQPRWRLQSAA
jgi:hypothetical protein